MITTELKTLYHLYQHGYNTVYEHLNKSAHGKLFNIMVNALLIELTSCQITHMVAHLKQQTTETYT